ncbi:Cyclin-L1-1 [Apostasia shenzhenica]|uniref:Cyclin-L1-1 n=1 Tax=Apostasia shenzhenica TaxID=1088818 RepID=A0A2I0B9X0_9ASPA|nr:Cyclin-L1-1 [Apostasia shenzhenica]
MDLSARVLQCLIGLFGSALSNDEASYPRLAARLSKPLVTDDGKIYTCSERNLFAFDRNGTVQWIVPLSHSCNMEISPAVDERGKIYVLTEDRILKVSPSHIGTSEPTVEAFFGPNSTVEGSGEIIGFSISILYSSLYITMKDRGLFAVLLGGKLLWSAGPTLYRFGYPQGCKENLRDCYFSSVPIIDQCEGTLYISNTEGQLYALYLRNPHFRWIQDLSSIDKLMIISSGNNGLLYVIFPAKDSIVALDAYTGNVTWQQTSGPLSIDLSSPIVDSNGWISIGSLDGYLYSFSPTGEVKKLLEAAASDSVIQASPVLDCSGFAVYTSQTVMEGKSSHVISNYTYISAMKPISFVFTVLTPATGTVYWTGRYPGIGITLPCYTMRHRNSWTCSQAQPKFSSTYIGNERAVVLFLFFQLAILLILSCCVRFCCIFWRKKKLQAHGLRSLHQRKKALRRVISELEEKAAEEASSHEALEQLGEMVKTKEGIERKLSTSYSLGRDSFGSRRGSLLPLYDGNGRSHSFQSPRNESVTIFNTLSESSTSIESGSSGRGEKWQSCGESEMAAKGKEPVGAVSSGSEENGSDGSPELASSSRFAGNPTAVEELGEGWGSRVTECAFFFHVIEQHRLAVLSHPFFIMIYTAIDTFYLTDEQLKNTPSRKDGIDEATEMLLRIYGCDLIQESGILLRLYPLLSLLFVLCRPQAVMATGQVLFHRFYCKKSFARFSVKRVAASCVWLASKLEENPRKLKYVLMVFHRMECRRENLPIVHLDVFSKKYSELKNDIIKTERHLLKEMGFICHVEHPHKFISNYLATLEAPSVLRQEAWNLANDSLRTTLCVRFKSEVVACGVVYAAARRFQVPLPENPPWWLVFDADQTGIEEVCSTLEVLYSLPKAQYISVYKDDDSFTSISRMPDRLPQGSQGNPLDGTTNDTSNPNDAKIKAALDKLKESKISDEDKEMLAETVGREGTTKYKGDHKSDANIEKNRERERERLKARERDRDSRTRDADHDSRGRDFDRDRDQEKERGHHYKEKSSGASNAIFLSCAIRYGWLYTHAIFSL